MTARAEKGSKEIAEGGREREGARRCKKKIETKREEKTEGGSGSK